MRKLYPKNLFEFDCPGMSDESLVRAVVDVRLEDLPDELPELVRGQFHPGKHRQEVLLTYPQLEELAAAPWVLRIAPRFGWKDALSAHLGTCDSSDMGATRWAAGERFVTVKHRMTKDFLENPIVTWGLWERRPRDEPSEHVALRTQPAPQSPSEAEPIALLLRAWLDGLTWAEAVDEPPETVVLLIGYAHRTAEDERQVAKVAIHLGGEPSPEGSRRYSAETRLLQATFPFEVAKEVFGGGLRWAKRSFELECGVFHVWNWQQDGDLELPQELKKAGASLVMLQMGQDASKFVFGQRG